MINIVRENQKIKHRKSDSALAYMKTCLKYFTKSANLNFTSSAYLSSFFSFRQHCVKCKSPSCNSLRDVVKIIRPLKESQTVMKYKCLTYVSIYFLLKIPTKIKSSENTHLISQTKPGRQNEFLIEFSLFNMDVTLLARNAICHGYKLTLQWLFIN